jgi:protein-S-isoprenylcysteine O-methyltransferase Ste14
MLLPGLVTVVVLFAQSLPIGTIPKQVSVSTMWHNMIDNLSCPGRTLCAAHHTQGVFHQETFTCTLPSSAITTLVTGAFFVAPTGRVVIHGDLSNVQHTPPLAQGSKALVRRGGWWLRFAHRCAGLRGLTV